MSKEVEEYQARKESIKQELAKLEVNQVVNITGVDMAPRIAVAEFMEQNPDIQLQFTTLTYERPNT